MRTFPAGSSCLVGALLGLAVGARAQTTSGTVAHDEVWSDTVRVTGDLYVPPEVTLTIAPGTVVLMAAGRDDEGTGGAGPVDPTTWALQPPDDRYGKTHVQLTVHGILRAVGTAEELIWFTSDGDPPAAADWVGMHLFGDVTLRHCVVEYAIDINVGSAQAEISDCVFRHLRHSVNFGAAATFSHNFIYDCNHEINARNSSPTFVDNVVYSSMALEFGGQALIERNVFKEVGAPLACGYWDRSTFRHNLVLGQDWGLLYRGNGIVEGNSIYGATYNLVIDAGEGPVDVSRNWWGTTDRAEILAGVNNYSGRPLTLEPWLEEPHPATPLPAPVGLAASSGPDEIEVSWDMPDLRRIAGYRIHYDTDPGFPYRGQGAAEGPSPVDVGNTLRHALSGLTPGQTYYLTVSAYDSTGRESWFSAEEIQRTTDQATGTIHGRVLDARILQPVSRATVSTAGFSALTDEAGRYAIADVPPGAYAVVATAAGYGEGRSDTVQVFAGARSVADVSLELQVEPGPWRNLRDLLGVGIGRLPVLCARTDPSGNVWPGLFGLGLLRFDGQSWSHYSMADGLAEEMVGAIAFGDSGTVWLGHKDFAFGSHFDGRQWHIVTQADGLAGDNVWAVAVDRQGEAWFGVGPVGVSRFDGSTWTTYTRDDGLVHNHVYAIAVDRANHKWFGTLEGVGRFDGSTWTRYTTDDGLPGNPVQSLYVDRDDNVWAGTSGYGAARYDRGTDRWIPYTAAEGLVGDHVTAIVQDGEGSMWFGTLYHGVTRFDGETWTNYSLREGLVFHVVTALAVDRGDNLWVGTWDGVSVLPRDRRTIPWDLEGDFDRDGVVGFEDFYLFADAFGGSEPLFDLDQSGAVDFEDFFLFASHFGEEERAKLTALAQERLGLPAVPRLEPVYPNPFNGEVTLHYQLAQEARVRLEVYSITGQRVRSLLCQVQESGHHEVVWDGTDDLGRTLASGVFLGRLQADGVPAVRKMLLVR
ncbi:MAG: two-component regulator propeller domain-containing protein [Candidatus Latescibacterota bacterium]